MALRAVSYVLLCALCWPLFSPAVATVEDSRPACCRRGGDHHCDMDKVPVESTGPMVRVQASASQCPMRCCPAPGIVLGQPATSANEWAILPTLAVATDSSQVFAASVVASILHERGPPAIC